MGPPTWQLLNIYNIVKWIFSTMLVSRHQWEQESCLHLVLWRISSNDPNADLLKQRRHTNQRIIRLCVLHLEVFIVFIFFFIHSQYKVKEFLLVQFCHRSPISLWYYILKKAQKTKLHHLPTVSPVSSQNARFHIL